ncbi:hypothetical protein FNYG_00134 [Fusarium nygamai]|uniref:Major facilitator superfamily (MFS) profile domain-containing protein n=1 Tax=Gibberella nygamai TaxID=42673 RepID=A0A2K0WVY2_GIBNY|nr:hypothetical protein FNYG_00134 [Fusarium nygamai]
MPSAKHIEQAIDSAAMGLGHDAGNKGYGKSSVNGKGSDLERGFTSPLPETHAQYLIHRHGTINLEPLPDPTDADPLNWPRHKKIINLMLVAFHACMGTFTGAAIIPAFGTIAEDLDVSVPTTTYLTSLQIMILGVAPFFWLPLSQRFGRRPIFLISLVCSLAGNIGCAKSMSYSSMAGSRAVVAAFIAPAGAIGSGVVQETFFKHERARYMGI